ncbi:MAG TPA: hypothetical protein DIT48_13145 [Actinobacteria bacterium]|jgi:hypothetical protein|nr:hypothetical protein [Actinomycetota bacterium]
MQLYSGATVNFLADATRNLIADKLATAFHEHFRYQPSQSEQRSWQNSLRAMADVVGLADLTDHGIAVELRLPLTSRRLDCMITGHVRGPLRSRSRPHVQESPARSRDASSNSAPSAGRCCCHGRPGQGEEGEDDQGNLRHLPPSPGR